MMTTSEQTCVNVQRSSCALLHCCLLLLRWWWLLFVLWWSCSVMMCSAARNLEHVPYRNSKPVDYRYLQKTAKREPDVCPTVRISSVATLNLLKNCRIVEGSIEIVRMKSVSEDEWKCWSFPDLVEITEFLLVYQVEGLHSLGQLFPNLAVIRGMKLVHHYSLVIYDTHLEEIGLHSLGAILRGSIRVQHNINLCYVHTVNWDAIVHSSDGNVLTDNSESLCKNCCPSCSSGQSREQQHCQYCWSSTKSQKICRQCSQGCTSESKCCHEQCVGGCQVPNNDRACRACRNYNTGYRCVKNCSNLLEH